MVRPAASPAFRRRFATANARTTDLTELLLYIYNFGSRLERLTHTKKRHVRMNLAIFIGQPLCNASMTVVYSLGDELTHSDIVMV